MQNFGENTLANYQKIQDIGKGAYGVVYKAKDVKNNNLVAVKQVIFEMENEGFPSTSIRQISLLRQIENPYIVKLIDVVTEQKKLYLIFQYLERDLKNYIESLGKNMINSAKVKKMMFQLISGVATCHTKRIIHRDLKPANLLLDKDDNIKIADFGLARTYSIPVRPYSHEVVTLWYRAPQILLGSYQYSTPIDMWAVGCIFAQIVTKRPLFQGDGDMDQLLRIFRILGTPNQTVWPGVTKLRDYKSSFPNWPANDITNVISSLNLEATGVDLLNKLLKYDPSARITAKAALQHPYFKDLQNKQIYK